jgi:transposase
MRLKGIGAEFAAVLYFEGLFRHFENRRRLAAYAGLAPSSWKSGSIDQEQGISKPGNPLLRTTMVELAWMWVRYQPDSALSCWFRQRVGSERGRIRRISIVALARKLLIALEIYQPWRDPGGCCREARLSHPGGRIIIVSSTRPDQPRWIRRADRRKQWF